MATGPSDARLGLLVRFFLRRFFHNDALSSGNDLGSSLSQTLAVVAGPGIAIPFLLVVKYGYLYGYYPALVPGEIWADRCFFVTYAMVVAGLAVTLQWDAFGLDRQDHAILGPLPVPRRWLLAANLLAQAAFPLALFVTANAGAVLLLPMAQMLGQSALLVPRVMAAHAVAAAVATAWVFFGLQTLRGLLATLLPPRLLERATPYLQTALVAGWLLLLLLYPEVVGAFSALERGESHAGLLLAPLWFTALFQQLATGTSGVAGALTHVCWTATAAAFVGFGLVTLSGFQRFARLTLGQEPEVVAPGGRSSAAWERLAPRDPVGRAGYHFVSRTLWRDRRHAVILVIATAVAFAVSVTVLVVSGPSGAEPRTADLAVPLIFCFCLVVAVRRAGALPADLPANWVFRLAPLEDRRALWRGARRAGLVTAVLVPLVVLAPLTALRLGALAAALHLLHVGVLACLLLEAAFLAFQRVPGASAYLSGSANLKLTWPLYVLGGVAFVSPVSRASPWLLAEPLRLACVVAVELVALFLLRRERNRRLLATPFAYAVADEDRPLELGLDC